MEKNFHQNYFLEPLHDCLEETFPECFNGIGKLKGRQIKLHINKDIKPVAQPHRRVPFHLRKKVEDELQNLEKMDIIEKIKGPTPWISPIVIAPKPNSDKIRICTDSRLVNTAIERERHPIPTIEDITHAIQGAKYFAKIDLKHGYLQCELDEESREITVFSTHVGLFRSKRLSFGITSAAEIFQNIVSQIISGIPNTINASDDIITAGSTLEELRKNVFEIFSRLEENGLTVNGEKCKFELNQINFYGFMFTDEGLKIGQNKVQAIAKACPPKTKSEVKSFLGLVNYCSRFIQDFATKAEPLRKLIRKNAVWKWNQQEEKAFKTMKNAVLNHSTNTYFDPSRKTELIADASPVGLGCVLIQKDEEDTPYIIEFASRTLSDVEKRYSQTEKEALSLVWSCERMKLYLLGQKFTLITDHKPLEIIFKNPKSKPNARIERWALRLQPFDFDIKYKPGEWNPSDYLSRNPVQTMKQDEGSENYVRFLLRHAKPNAIKMNEIILETEKDLKLQKFIKWLNNSSLIPSKIEDPQLRSLVTIKTEVSQVDGILLRQNRLIIPEKLQQKCVDLAHEGHQGIVETKSLLR